MTDQSNFKSRSGNLSCKPAEVYKFVSDFRNLKQIIPDGKLIEWQATGDSCSFMVPPLGAVNIKITEKIPFSLVVFSGNALSKNDFKLQLAISEDSNGKAIVNVSVTAGLNPLLLMMATKPIEQFLDRLIDEMENFNDWNTTI